MAIFKKNVELHPRLRVGVGRGYSKNLILKFSGILFLCAAIGLTGNAIRLIAVRDTNPKTAQALPQVLGVSDTRIVNTSSGVEFVEYKVQKGDTLFNVSQHFNISWTTLATLNNLQSPYTLKLGQVIKIPQ